MILMHMQQESIQVGCIPPACHHTQGNSIRGLCQGDPSTDSPGQRFPRQRPLERELPEGTWDQVQRPLEGTWDQAARQEVTSYRDPPVNRMTGTHL